MADDYLEGIPEEELQDFIAWREKVEGSNISTKTLLATDYLNHFNEIIMLLEMVADMPDILEEAKAWEPKSYVEFVGNSSFSDRDMAVEAYSHVPTKYREPFEKTIATMDKLIMQSIEHLEATIQTGDSELLHVKASACSQAVQRVMDVASGIIHGSTSTMDQDEIDDLLDAAGGPMPRSGGTAATADDADAQAAIDALFD